MSYLFENYAPLPVTFVSGQGCWLTDTNGVQYFDALCGVGVTNLGHSHPAITDVIIKQAKNLLHTSNWYHIQAQEALAQKLCQKSNMAKVFFANSGAEANEAAIKLTRLYARQKKIANPIILTCYKSFHGRTMATLSATGNEKIQKGFSPLLAEFIYIDFNDINAIKEHSHNSNIVALMLEPILGEAGVIIPKSDYLNKAQNICRQNDWLFILDEVQTGIGRTGRLFAHQYNDITPDILTLAKGLGNGLPIGACLGSDKVANLFTPGSHGSTFGGNPLCSNVAISVLATIEKDNILDNVLEQSTYFLSQAKTRLSQYICIKDIRAKGLMLAITLDKAYPNIINNALNFNLLINANSQHIRLLPALIITKVEIDILLTKLVQLIEDL